MTRQSYVLVTACLTVLFAASCTYQYDHLFRAEKAERIKKTAGWAFEPEMWSFQNGYKETFDRPMAQMFMLKVRAVNSECKKSGTIEALSMDSAVLRYLPGEEVRRVVVSHSTCLSYSDESDLRYVLTLASAPDNQRSFFVPDSIDTIILEFDAVLRLAELTKSRRSAVGYDSLVVEPDAPERRVPVSITMTRHTPRRLMPYFVRWLPSH